VKPTESEGSAAAEAVEQTLSGKRVPYVADRTLELPMTLISRTVKRTARAISELETGQILAVRTDDP
jgi:hypothetical protein